jgi:addiction module HigA family antidote
LGKTLLKHPGEVLREEYLERLGLSANALAMALHVPSTRISEIIRGRRSLSADTALRLERYFGFDKCSKTAHEWMELQCRYELSKIGPEERRRIESEVRAAQRVGKGAR